MEKQHVGTSVTYQESHQAMVCFRTGPQTVDLLATCCDHLNVWLPEPVVVTWAPRFGKLWTAALTLLIFEKVGALLLRPQEFLILCVTLVYHVPSIISVDGIFLFQKRSTQWTAEARASCRSALECSARATPSGGATGRLDALLWAGDRERLNGETWGVTLQDQGSRLTTIYYIILYYIYYIIFYYIILSYLILSYLILYYIVLYYIILYYLILYYIILYYNIWTAQGGGGSFQP